VGFESPVSATHAVSMMNGLRLSGDKKLLVDVAIPSIHY